MKFALPFAAALLAAPVSLAFAADAEPEAAPADEIKAEAEADGSKDAGQPDAGKTTEAKEEKRICRRIRADASSRRKTKLCLTSDEWRQYNNIK